MITTTLDILALTFWNSKFVLGVICNGFESVEELLSSFDMRALHLVKSLHVGGRWDGDLPVVSWSSSSQRHFLTFQRVGGWNSSIMIKECIQFYLFCSPHQQGFVFVWSEIRLHNHFWNKNNSASHWLKDLTPGILLVDKLTQHPNETQYAMIMRIRSKKIL